MVAELRGRGCRAGAVGTAESARRGATQRGADERRRETEPAPARLEGHPAWSHLQAGFATPPESHAS